MRFPRSAAAASCAAAVLSFGPSAFAYCRTITEPLPASYNPSQCYEPSGAIPLWWKNASVGYSLQKDASSQVPLADAKTAMTTAFAKWSDAGCAAGNPSIKAVQEDDVDCDKVQYSEAGPNQHAIIFRDATWPHDEDPNNTLALTTVTFDTHTGELYDADMEINTAQNKVVLDGAATGANAYDFDSIVTHEVGHFLGLAHSTDTTAVMYAHYKPHSSTLTADDVAGICAIYDPSGSRATATGAVGEGPDDPTPRHGFGTACGPVGAVTSTSSGKCAVGPAPGDEPSGGTFWAFGAVAGAAAVVRRRGARLRRMKSGLRSAVVASLLALGVGTLATVAVERDAQASVSIAILLDELVRDSSAAAMVTPVEQKSVWEDGRIYTYTRVHVDRAVAGGGTAGDEMWVRTLGGTVGRIGQLVDGEAVLTVGRPSLLFVKPAADVQGIFLVTGRAQGQFPVVLDETTKAPLLIHAGSAGALVPPTTARVLEVTKLRALAGLPSAPRLAAEALHKRPVEDALGEIAASWARLHAAP